MKSTVAVIAGALTSILLALATDALMRSAGFFPAHGPAMRSSDFLFATAYRTVYGIAGAYLTARLAPSRPMLHAMILGMLALAASIVGAAVTWNTVPPLGPHWYPVALVVLALPTAWAGGWLAAARLSGIPPAD
jgi:hypothetical protein